MNLTTLTALAEPHRLRIVELLREKPRSVNEIAGALTLIQPQVSKHLKVLSEAGLVEIHPRAQQRIYALKGEPFEALNQWIESFRRVWEERFDAIDGLLEELTDDDGQDNPTLNGTDE